VWCSETNKQVHQQVGPHVVYDGLGGVPLSESNRVVQVYAEQGNVAHSINDSWISLPCHWCEKSVAMVSARLWAHQEVGRLIEWLGEVRPLALDHLDYHSERLWHDQNVGENDGGIELEAIERLCTSAVAVAV
jgi:hypothetical protein